jgi:hypothetical protein
MPLLGVVTSLAQRLNAAPTAVQLVTEVEARQSAGSCHLLGEHGNRALRGLAL